MHFYKQIFKLGLCLLAPLGGLRSQSQLYRDTVVVKENGITLRNPWAGGLNFCEVSQIDLDLDGRKDLVIFDKVSSSGGKLRTYLNRGGPGQTLYKHAPHYQALFPPVTDWAMFLDYDGDGLEDIFTYASGVGGVKVFRNMTAVAGTFSFSLVKSMVRSDYNPNGAPDVSNLYCSSVGLPGIGDIDGDGDLDMLSYSVFGIQMQYHKNMSVETYGHRDSLTYEMVDNCWGDVYENNCQVALYQCPYPKMYQQLISNSQDVKKVLHAGSCIMCFDRDGDGDQDLLLGDVSCSIIHYVDNEGSSSNAHITDTTQLYPNYPAKANTTPIRMNSFPCTYYLDLNNDGKKDLLASPNAVAGAENYNSLWYYKNLSTSATVDFSFQQKNFLQDQMIELGEGAYPTLFDADSDGKLDLLIGNEGYYTNLSNVSKIAFYKNTGTLAVPSFSLITRDYQNLTQYNLLSMFPTFGDLDGDGDKDMLIGDFNGTLSFLRNNATTGNPAVFGNYQANYSSIDVGNYATPQLVDVDLDGDLDLLIGNQTGKITYYKNTGSASAPNFALQTASFGGVSVRQWGYITGYSVPFLYNDLGVSKLLVGSELGTIYLYDNIDGNLGGTFNKVDTNLYQIHEGVRSAPHFVDMNNDGQRDLITGNYAGGLAFFSSIPNTIGVEELDMNSLVTVFPNPVTDQLTVSIDSEALLDVTYVLYDALGHEVMRTTNANALNRFDVSGLAPGFYVMEMSFRKNKQLLPGRATKKIIVH